MNAAFNQMPPASSGAELLGVSSEEFALPEGAAVPISMVLASFAQLYRCSFSYQGRSIDPDVIFAGEMLLPAVIWEAQMKGKQLLDADLGCHLRLDHESMCGVRAVVPFVTGHLADIVRALLCLHCARNLLLISQDANVEISMVVDTYKKHFSKLMECSSENGEIQWPHQVQ